MFQVVFDLKSRHANRILKWFQCYCKTNSNLNRPVANFPEPAFSGQCKKHDLLMMCCLVGVSVQRGGCHLPLDGGRGGRAASPLISRGAGGGGLGQGGRPKEWHEKLYFYQYWIFERMSFGPSREMRSCAMWGLLLCSCAVGLLLLCCGAGGTRAGERVVLVRVPLYTGQVAYLCIYNY